MANIMQTPVFLIGRSSRGQWVVRDRSCQRGGLFVSQAAALRYARLETGGRTPALTMVPGTLELDLSAR